MTSLRSRTLVIFTSFALITALTPLLAFASPELSATALPSDTSVVSAPLTGQSLSTQATTTKKKASYSIKKYSDSKKYGKISVTFSYAEPVLKGSSNIVKKINKSLHTQYKKSLKTYSTAKTYAKNDAANNYTSASSKYFAKTSTKVTYNKNGYFSLKYASNNYVGGARDTSGTSGATYSLKTGKKLNVSNVASGSATDVKNKIASAIVKKYNYSPIYSEINQKKISDIDFYLSNGKVVVPYYVSAVSTTMTVTLPGNYA